MKLAEKYALVEERMRGIEPIPHDFPKYIEDNIKHHLFYSRKDGMCYCSKCKEVVPYQPLSHKAPAICPKCGTQAIAKSVGYSRKEKEINWFTLVQHFEDGLVVRHFRTLVDWQDYKNPILETEEEWRNVVTPSKFDAYMWWWRYGEAVKAWIPEKKRGMGCYAYEGEMYHPYTSKCYTDLDEVIKGTWFQHSCLKGLMKDFGKIKANGDIECYGIEWTLNSYRCAPYLEQVYKVGFHALITSLKTLYYTGTYAVFQSGTNICQILGVSHAQFKMLLKRGDPSVDELAVLQNNRNLTDYDEWLFSAKLLSVRDSTTLIADMQRRKPLKKFIRYFNACNINPDEYRDHLRWLTELGYPNDDYYLFPRDFRSAHARLALEVVDSTKAKADYEKAMQTIVMKKLAEEKRAIKAFSLHYKGLFLKIADSAGSLIAEGKYLHHCVGGYVNRVVSGETTILFVRKESQPDIPFYTMEFKNGSVTQLYGKYDCRATPEVQEFSDEFMRRITNELRKERKAA